MVWILPHDSDHVTRVGMTHKKGQLPFPLAKPTACKYFGHLQRDARTEHHKCLLRRRVGCGKRAEHALNLFVRKNVGRNTLLILCPHQLQHLRQVVPRRPGLWGTAVYG